jgi:SAM-dependent methyltransferase
MGWYLEPGKKLFGKKVTNLPASFWHERYVQQASWTQGLRYHLYQRANLTQAKRIIEIGCGTGAILTELLMQSHGAIFGIDISAEYLDLAVASLPGIPLIRGDARKLPITTGVFDIALCHFVILWVADPLSLIREMTRVTKPGGLVLALAEPDYGGRIDYPEELGILGDLQQAALHQAGADPLLGRKLRSLFQQAGLGSIEAGILGGQWSGRPLAEDIEKEWIVLEDDIMAQKTISEPDFNSLHTLDKLAWERGERILFVPTFYAWGQVLPGN